jgi:hypothetical protein
MQCKQLKEVLWELAGRGDDWRAAILSTSFSCCMFVSWHLCCAVLCCCAVPCCAASSDLFSSLLPSYVLLYA